MKRVTGIGGIFFRSRDPDALKKWYVEHLGIPMDDDGFVCFYGKDDEGAKEAARSTDSPALESMFLNEWKEKFQRNNFKE